jgi:hypothetical protein
LTDFEILYQGELLLSTGYDDPKFQIFLEKIRRRGIQSLPSQTLMPGIP